MTTTKSCDILVVGAATAGVYFGWLMAKKGFSVHIIDKEPRNDVGQRLEVIHFNNEQMELAGVPPPLEEPELIEVWEGGAEFATNTDAPDEIRIPQTVLRLPNFLQRMYKILEKDGVTFNFSCKFQKLILENNKIKGIVAENENEKIEINAKLVLDASGCACAVRSSLPDDFGVDNWKYGSNNRFFVILHYIQWLKPEEPHPEPGQGNKYYLEFLDPSYVENGAILGIAGPESFKKAELILKDYLKRENWPEFKVLKKEFGYFPYCKPPYSLVGDNFFCVGDAAAITHPLSGHGVSENWFLCKIAANIIGESLKDNENPTQESMWPVNVKYFRTIGAEYAYLFMIISAIMPFSEKEIDFLFTNLGFLFHSSDNKINPEDYENQEDSMSFKNLLKTVIIVLKGLIFGKLKFKNIMNLLKVNGFANEIKEHYKNYPSSPSGFNVWKEKANRIWKNRKPHTKKFPSTEVTYP